jgi:hypothetical protein
MSDDESNLNSKLELVKFDTAQNADEDSNRTQSKGVPETAGKLTVVLLCQYAPENVALPLATSTVFL